MVFLEFWNFEWKVLKFQKKNKLAPANTYGFPINLLFYVS
jgi:hypothetical protein